MIQWVKCSERLPENDGLYCFKKEGGYMEAYITTDPLGTKWVHDSNAHTVRNWKILEWLDESDESPTAAGDGKEAIDIMLWAFTFIDAWDKKSNTVTLFNGEMRPVDDLPNIFKQQNK